MRRRGAEGSEASVSEREGRGTVCHLRAVRGEGGKASRGGDEVPSIGGGDGRVKSRICSAYVLEASSEVATEASSCGRLDPLPSLSLPGRVVSRVGIARELRVHAEVIHSPHDRARLVGQVLLATRSAIMKLVLKTIFD